MLLLLLLLFVVFLYSVSSGVKALIVIVVVLVLGSCVFIGVTLCVVAFVMYKKKKSSRVRTVNVGQDSTEENYRMSGVTEQENIATAAPPPRYTPSPFTPIVVPQENDNSQNPPSHFTPIVLQQENANSQNQIITEKTATVQEEDIEDGDENKPLIS